MLSSSGNKTQPPPREREREYQLVPKIPRSIAHPLCMITTTVVRTCGRHTRIDRLTSQDPLTTVIIPTSSFAMAPTSVPPPIPPSSHMNGSGIGSPDKGQTIWMEDPSYRMPPAGYLHLRKPIDLPFKHTGHGPSSSIHRMVAPQPSSPSIQFLFSFTESTMIASHLYVHCDIVEGAFDTNLSSLACWT